MPGSDRCPVPGSKPGAWAPLSTAVAFSVLLALPFLGKAFHMDEPLFLFTAEHLLADPFRPGGFAFNWYGVSETMARVNNNPPLLSYLLAPVLSLTGGREWVTRLAFLPFDMLAAGALYLLAARFLARPLLPVLIVLAGPAYLVNMGHLMAEKPAFAFGVSGLYALVRGVEDGRQRWERAGMALLALAVLSKTGAVLFLVPAAALLLQRGRGVEGAMGFCGWTLLPALGVALWQDLAGLGGMGPTLGVLRRSYGLTSWPYKLRAFFAFAGACGVATAAWPFWVLRRRPGLLAVAGAAAGLLLLPAFDLRAVALPDRVFGFVSAASAMAGFLSLGLPETRRSPGWILWTAWICAAAALQLCLYWGVLARIVLFLTPPFVFLLAGRLEGSLKPRILAVVYAASLALTLAVGLGSAWVDRRYADSQKRFASEVAGPVVAAGKKVFFAGHWGLQYYMEKAGAIPLDESKGGYEAMKKGDLFALSRVNSNNSLLGEPRLSQGHVIRHDREIQVRSSVPLRLISGWTGQAGFYADSWGFLPYSFSTEPVEEFALGEHQ
ncbi:MAG: glycosyltransferase family 39 protein [Elusimicrobia bacterium]|nr:glycosyltransferase family 39 protein [Elusimicrobiota bacterium]